MIGDPPLQNRRLRCFYHKDYEHLMKDCKALKQFLEELAQNGHLRSYIDSFSDQKRKGRDTGGDAQPTATINMIYSVPAKMQASQKKEEIRMSVPHKEVMALLGAFTKKMCSSKLRIAFSDKDLTWVHHPHNDVLVITL
ncbi:uncharacterized protein LOC114263994 [Camellia sinensis]|uniref:uncharacterized protein LOC114263994 n=1 Tax=Camellia sinensis TaxID=4442 RepID=UPI0010356949|nr:uncharacterized protein LOC114263994 [Camellia sinensis]